MLSHEIQDLLLHAAEDADRDLNWPSDSMEALRKAGCLGWSVPTEYGGTALTTGDLFTGHEQIASACLTTSFILSQREAAIRRLALGPEHLRQRFLPGLATGELFATVGLSQLTTSRQHGAPALQAVPQSDGSYQLNGTIPWVTGADQADVIIVGATLEDKTQILFALPTGKPGVTFDAPVPLAASSGSRTCAVLCEHVMIESELLLAGPVEQVLGPVGGGGLETSNLALGLSEAATDYLEHEAEIRTDMNEVATHFRSCVDEIRSRLHKLAVSPKNSEATMKIRSECTLLAMRSSQMCLLVAKGAGFVVPHPAQRWSRQAMFFLVWSCPRPVAMGVVESLMMDGQNQSECHG